MNILNPNKYVRTGLITAIKAVIPNIGIYYKILPLNVKPVPKTYVILDSQTKNETVLSKSTEEKATNFEWLTTIDINIYNLNDKGFSDAEIVDDLEQKILSVVRTGFNIPNFDTKDVRILESLDLSAQAGSNYVDRKMLKIEIWLNNVSA